MTQQDKEVRLEYEIRRDWECRGGILGFIHGTPYDVYRRVTGHSDYDGKWHRVGYRGSRWLAQQLLRRNRRKWARKLFSPEATVLYREVNGVTAPAPLPDARHPDADVTAPRGRVNVNHTVCNLTLLINVIALPLFTYVAVAKDWTVGLVIPFLALATAVQHIGVRTPFGVWLLRRVAGGKR